MRFGGAALGIWGKVPMRRTPEIDRAVVNLLKRGEDVRSIRD